ncbi:hypothetical protein RRG08_052397 [Elysia crispata]|uniref:Uncharacterized protein n=1 Tax=Elysia crispata TaxID=231223 RepID=A0AAE1B1D4_9GAST|nr:hypothetical protein RRG08_052397 [Elysia crispata]
MKQAQPSSVFSSLACGLPLFGILSPNFCSPTTNYECLLSALWILASVQTGSLRARKLILPLLRVGALCLRQPLSQERGDSQSKLTSTRYHNPSREYKAATGWLTCTSFP